MNPLLSAQCISEKATHVFINNTGLESAAELVSVWCAFIGKHIKCFSTVYLDLIRDQTP